MHGISAVVVVAVVCKTGVEVLVLARMRSRTAGSLRHRRDRHQSGEGEYQAVRPEFPARGELRITHSANIHDPPRSSCPPAFPATRVRAASPVGHVIILVAAPGLPYARAPDTRTANTVSTIPGGRVE